MARKNPLVKPLNKLKDTALGAISDPKGTADKVVEQAKGAASLGKMVAEGVAGEVVSRTRGRKASDAPSAEAPPAQPATAPPAKKQGDPLSPDAKAATKTATKKSATKKSATAKTPAQEPAPAEPPVDLDDKRAAKQASPADVAKKAAKKAPAKKTGKQAPQKSAGPKPAAKQPAKKAAQAPAEKTSAKKTPGKKAPAKKTPGKKTSAGSPGDKLPPRKRTTSAAELAEGGPGVRTPVGTTGAAPGTNPDTAESDLQQPGTEGIVESSTAKKIAKEAERGRRDAEQ